MPHIQYDHLTFKNGYVYRHCDLPLDGQGLVLVRGLNVDDGGFLACGKTSLWEIFSSIQVGYGGRGSGQEFSKNDVVNDLAGKDFEAVLKYRVDGRPFEIRQYRKHTLHGDAIRVVDTSTGQNIIPSRAARAPHKWIREAHLGLDDTSFFNLVYLPQKLSHVLLHGKRSDRYKRLTEMFGLDVFDNMYAIFRDREKSVATSLVDIEALERELGSLEARAGDIGDVDKMRSRLKKRKRQLKELRTESNAAVQESRELRDRLNQLDQRKQLIEQVRVIWDDADLGKWYDKPSDIDDAEVESIDQQATDASDAYHTAQRQREAAQRRDILERQLSKLSGRALADIDTDLSEVKSQLRYLQNTELPQAEQRYEITEELAGLDKPPENVEPLRKQVEAYMREEGALEREIEVTVRHLDKSVCPTCHRPLDTKSDPEALREKLRGARQQLRKVKKEIFAAKSALETSEKYEQLAARLKSIDTTRTPVEVQRDIRTATKREKELVAEKEISQQKHDLEIQIQEIDARGTVPEEQIAGLHKKANALRRRAKAIARVRTRIDQMDDLPKGNREQTAEQLARAEKIVSSATAQTEDLSRQIAILEERLSASETLQARLAQVRKGLAKGTGILRNKRCLEALKKAFGSQGLKQDRFRAILQDATETTVPVYSSVLWPRRTVDLELSESMDAIQFQLRRRDGNIATRSSLLSGGEQHKSGLAMLFGMRDLKERYTESSTNVLIVDEPFGSLDPQGTAGLISILGMLRQKFGSVFVVSHRPEVLADPVWDQVWWAVRENNESTLYRGGIPARYQQIAARYDRS